MESPTLDEQAYLRLVAEDDVQPAPPHAAPDPGDRRAPDPLDFSGLLDRTSHGASAATPAAPTPPAPVAAPAPDPPTAVHPAAVEPRPSAPRAPISAVPASTGPASAPAAAAAGTGLGEHDGRTVTLADLRRLQEEAGAAPADGPSAPEPAPAHPSEVRAVRCPAGHANPPTATTCRICRAAIVDTAVVRVPRPVIARLVFESGLVVDVDRPQVIGRRPTAPPQTDELPNLVTVPSPDGDISRVHTAVRVEGWDVLVEDTGSTNGTEVRLPGRDPVRLREHDPVLVVAGTEVVLAGTVRFTVEAVAP